MNESFHNYYNYKSFVGLYPRMFDFKNAFYTHFSSLAWYEGLNPGKPVTQLSKIELAEVVKNFYMTTRKKDGNPYKLCSYLAIRRCLSLIFQYDYGLMHVDISCDPEFLNANVVFSQMSHSLRGREENFGVTESWRLTPEKLKKLYVEGQLDFYNTQNPKVLLQTVYFYVCYYTGIGKLSVMRQVVTNDIEEVLENGRLIAYNLDLRKYLPSEKGYGPFTIYEIQGKPWCPVLTIREYLLHRNKSVQSFFQKPLARGQCFGSSVWFKRSRFKDVYPLATMCHEAHIDPPLTSGCFTKSRISAEIRYEMSFIYAKLFPQCFNSTDEVQQRIKLNVAKKKRGRKQSATFSSTSRPVNDARSKGDIANLRTVNQTGYDLPDDIPTPPSMVVSRSFNGSASYRQPVNQVALREPFEPTVTTINESQVTSRHQIAQIDTSNSNLLQPSEIPTISVTNVYSCRRDINGPSRKQHDTINRFNTSQTMQSTQSGQPGTVQSVDITLTKDTGMRSDLATAVNKVISIDDEDNDIVETSKDTIRSDNFSFSRDLRESGNALAQPQASNNYSSANSVTSVYHPTQSLSNNTGSQFEPQIKRSRFDSSSHTFLREISASAREQGKGAVMLLLSLLDDLSNNRGKELLKDILQEMKVI